MMSLMCIPEWYPVGFKRRNRKEGQIFKCTACGITCKFFLQEGATLPDMCIKRRLKVKPIKHQAEGEPLNEREAFLLKTIAKRGAL